MLKLILSLVLFAACLSPQSVIVIKKKAAGAPDLPLTSLSAFYTFAPSAGDWWADAEANQAVNDFSGNTLHGQLGSTSGADADDPTTVEDGAQYDGGDYVDLPNLGTGHSATVVFYVPSDITPATTAQYLYSADTTSQTIALGASAAGLTNEIVSVFSTGTSGRAGWCDAGGSIAAGWHTLQVLWVDSTWQIWLDNTQKTTTVSGTEAAWAGNAAAALGSSSNGTSARVANGTIIAAFLYRSGVGFTRQDEYLALKAKFATDRGISLP